MISPEEMQRRRKAVQAALANNRLEGMWPDDGTLEICEAYIRGEIETADLMTALKRSR
jgi:hypothetical protein